MDTAPLDFAAELTRRISNTLRSGNAVHWRSDFDGTVAPFVDVPPLAVPHPVVLAAYERMASIPGVDVGFLTGRPLSFMDERFEARFHLDCSYGFERRAGDEYWRHPALESAQGAIGEATDDIGRAVEAAGAHWTRDPIAARDEDKLFIEVKAAGIAIHDGPAIAGNPRSNAPVMRKRVAEALGPELHGLKGHENNGNYEYSVDTEALGLKIDKGAVIRAIEGDGLVVYCGDDSGDLPAVDATLERGGVVIGVEQKPDALRRGSPPELLERATYVVDGVDGFAALVDELSRMV